jgi:hypothetical protein
MIGAEYRTKAAQLFEQARREPDMVVQRRLQHLALAYVDLAEQADKKTEHRFDHGVPALLPDQPEK